MAASSGSAQIPVIERRPRAWAGCRRFSKIASFIVTLCAGAAVLYAVDTPKLLTVLRQISLTALLLATASLIANLSANYFRFQTTLQALGARPLNHRLLLIAFAWGNLAGHFLLNVIGQSFTRATILQRAGVPIGTTIVATYVERFTALMTLGAAALVSVFLLFGAVHIEFGRGGIYFVELAIGSAIVISVSCVWAIYQLADRNDLRAALHTSIRLIPAITFGIASHIMMLVAYLILFLPFTGGVNPVDLTAGVLVVMFVASLPISLSGWGLREFSAAYVLSAIGVQTEAAILVAAVVGVLTLAFNLISGLIVDVIPWRKQLAAAPAVNSAAGYDGLSQQVLIWPIAILTAGLIFFQIRVLVVTQEVTVNAADFLAVTELLFAGFFSPKVKVFSHFPAGVVSSIVRLGGVLALGAVIGYVRFGWVQWAIVNRLLGYPILVGYFVRRGACGDCSRRTGTNSHCAAIRRQRCDYHSARADHLRLQRRFFIRRLIFRLFCKAMRRMPPRLACNC